MDGRPFTIGWIFRHAFGGPGLAALVACQNRLSVGLPRSSGDSDGQLESAASGGLCAGSGRVGPRSGEVTPRPYRDRGRYHIPIGPDWRHRKNSAT